MKRRGKLIIPISIVLILLIILGGQYLLSGLFSLTPTYILGVKVVTSDGVPVENAYVSISYTYPIITESGHKYNTSILGDGYTDGNGYIRFTIVKDIFKSWREFLTKQGIKPGEFKTSISIRVYVFGSNDNIIDHVADGLLIDPFKLTLVTSKIIKLHISSRDLNKAVKHERGILGEEPGIIRRLVEHKELIGEWVPIIWVSNGGYDTYAIATFTLGMFGARIKLGLGIEYPSGGKSFEFGEVTIDLTGKVGGEGFNVPPGYSRYGVFKADLVYEKYFVENRVGTILEVDHEVKVTYVYIQQNWEIVTAVIDGVPPGNPTIMFYDDYIGTGHNHDYDIEDSPYDIDIWTPDLMQKVVGTTSYGTTVSLPVGYILKTVFGLPSIVSFIVTCTDIYWLTYFEARFDDDCGEYFYVYTYHTTEKYKFGDGEYYIPYAYINIFDDNS